MMPKAKAYNLATIAAAVVLVGVVAAEVLVPKPVAEIDDGSRAADLQKTGRDTENLQADLVDATAEVSKLTWDLTVDEIAPAAMKWVTEHAGEHFVEVSSFRPQRRTDVDGLVQLNYLVIAEGAFPNMMDFVRAFEADDSLMAVKLVQLSGVDGVTDRVRATIGIATFVEGATDEK